MVLGGQPPGRVGRRRFFFDSWAAPHGAALCRSATEGHAAIADSPRWGEVNGPLASTQFAARRRSPNGLKPVLAEGCEVDQQINGVGEPIADFLLGFEHRFVI